MLITTTKSLQQEMIDDFLSELNELTILLKGSPSSLEKERAVNRKYVVEQSIQELQKQLIDPTRHVRQTEGGYTQEELDRFEAVRQQQVSQQDFRRPPPPDIYNNIL